MCEEKEGPPSRSSSTATTTTIPDTHLTRPRHLGALTGFDSLCVAGNGVHFRGRPGHLSVSTRPSRPRQEHRHRLPVSHPRRARHPRAEDGTAAVRPAGGIDGERRSTDHHRGRRRCRLPARPVTGAALRPRRQRRPGGVAQTAAITDLYRRQIAARTAYELAPKGRPDSEGHERLTCPAAAGKVRCPIKRTGIGTNPRLPLVHPAPSPVGPPKICRQHSITIAPEHGAKHTQALAYGTTDQQRVYHRLRNSTEGFNGYAKDDAHEAIERSQGRRIRGIAAQSLLPAFQLAHANFRKIFSRLDSLPRANGRPRRRIRRRATKPLADWKP